MYIGVYVYRMHTPYIVRYAPWLAPVTASAGVLVLLYALLAAYRRVSMRVADAGEHACMHGAAGACRRRAPPLALPCCVLISS